MLFKDGELASEFVRAPPELRTAIHDADDMMVENGHGQLTITDVGREPSFYDPSDPGWVWSWHFVFSAVDIRVRDLAPSVVTFLVDWLKRHLAHDKRFQVVPELKAKRGPHIHIEFEDAGLKRDWLLKHRAGVA